MQDVLQEIVGSIRTLLYCVSMKDGGIIICHSLEGIAEQDEEDVLDCDYDFVEDDADAEYYQQRIDGCEKRHMNAFQSDYHDESYADDEDEGTDDLRPIMNVLRHEREKDVWEYDLDDSDSVYELEGLPNIQCYDELMAEDYV